MSWDYSGFLAEKIEAGRRLLASDPAFEGSEELQAMVEDKDRTLGLRRAFLLPSGERQRGLSLHDKRQGLILFLHCVRHKLRLRTFEVFNTQQSQALKECLFNAIEECSLPQGGRSPDPTSKHLGAVSVLVLSMLVEEPDSPMLRRDVSNLCGKQWSSGDVANAEALEAGLRAAGHDPLLTAADQEQLVLLLLPYAARYMSGTRQPPQLTAMLRPSAVDATRRLVLQEPGSALLKNLHAFMVSMDPRQSAQGPAAYRDALQAAQATKSHLLTGHSAFTVALYAVRGGEGPTWSVAEVRSLLQLAQRSFKLCRPFSWHEGPILEDLKKLEKEVARAAAARPGAQRLPQTASISSVTVRQSIDAAACDACGQECLKLRRCGACKARAYCCRECQVADWKRGHKAECAQLAAQRGGGA